MSPIQHRRSCARWNLKRLVSPPPTQRAGFSENDVCFENANLWVGGYDIVTGMNSKQRAFNYAMNIPCLCEISPTLDEESECRRMSPCHAFEQNSTFIFSAALRVLVF